jgi:uncharacterized repeat protein (TIGR01451 family)
MVFSRSQLAASTAATLAVCAAFVLTVASAAAAAPPKPGSKPASRPVSPLPGTITETPTAEPTPGKLVTFAARSCPTYDAVTANLARNNIQESLQDLGADTLYQSGQAIDPSIEKSGQPSCTPLSDWTFVLGTGYRSRAVTGSWGSLSIVSGAFPTSIVTKSSVPLLNSLGENTGSTIAGAVTIRLTDEQVNLASRASSLWAQGGTTSDPVLDQQYPHQYGFAALRCAVDNLNGDNVEWIGYPAGASHVFCFAYYVKPPPTSGTIIVRKEVSAPAGATQTFRFTGNISYASDGSFNLGVANGTPAAETFYRAETSAGDAPWDFQEQVPDGWKLTGISCTSQTGKSVTSTDLTRARTTVTLAPRDTVTCTYTDALAPAAGTLAIAKTTIGGTGTFGYTVTAADPSGPAPVKATATTTKAGIEVAANPERITLPPGTYKIAETLPSAPDGTWKLTGAQCNGVKVPAANPVTVTITAGEGATCSFENTLTPDGKIVIRKVAYGKTGTAGFSIYYGASPARGTPAPYNKTAKVGKEGVSVLATGDRTDALALGTYRIQEFASAGTDPAGWALTSVVCDGKPIGASQGAVSVKLTHDKPVIDCTFTNTWTKPGGGGGGEITQPPVVPPDPSPETQLSVSKTANRTSIQVGENVTYTIVVRNTGTEPAQGVSIAEQTPRTAEIVSVTPSQGTCHTTHWPVSCELGTIEPGKSATVIATLRATKTGPMANNVAVNSATVDPKPPSAGTVGNATPRPSRPREPKPPSGAFVG